MAIPMPPNYMGIPAKNETGQALMSLARVAVRLSAAGYMSEMGGRSMEAQYLIEENLAFDRNVLIAWIREQGATPIVITIRGNVVSAASNAPTLEFPADLPSATIKVIVEPGANLLGKGGNGGSGGSNSKGNAGGAGGTAINNLIGTRLSVDNQGVISGGGGGGAAGTAIIPTPPTGIRIVGYHGGGGGAPLGNAGAANLSGGAGRAGTLTAGGAGGTATNIQGAGMAGGGWGLNGNGGGSNSNAGGTRGWAVQSQSPTWINKGDIRGQSVA